MKIFSKIKYFLGGFVLLAASLAYADCDTALNADSALTNGVTAKLWSEAIEAEKNLFYSRFASEALVRNALAEIQMIKSLEEENVAEVANVENDVEAKAEVEANNEEIEVDQEAFVELVARVAYQFSDGFHFGVKMEIPIVDDPTIDLNKLAAKVSDQMPTDALLGKASQIVFEILETKKDLYPTYFVKSKEVLESKYEPVHVALQQDGAEHTEVYEYKHDYLEINNFAARVNHQAKNGNQNIGFLPVQGSDDAEKLSSIGFVIESKKNEP